MAFKKGNKPWNKGKKTGLAPWKGKKRPNVSGAKSNFWKGGIYPKHRTIRKSLEYRLWREAVFTRDDYTCIWCGDRCGKGNKVVLNADHIKSFAHYPELRFAIDNGRTLCETCHRTTDTFGGRSRGK